MLLAVLCSFGKRALLTIEKKCSFSYITLKTFKDQR